jgi:hypothetical protein
MQDQSAIGKIVASKPFGMTRNPLNSELMSLTSGSETGCFIRELVLLVSGQQTGQGMYAVQLFIGHLKLCLNTAMINPRSIIPHYFWTSSIISMPSSSLHRSVADLTCAPRMVMLPHRSPHAALVIPDQPDLTRPYLDVEQPEPLDGEEFEVDEDFNSAVVLRK